MMLFSRSVTNSLMPTHFGEFLDELLDQTLCSPSSTVTEFGVEKPEHEVEAPAVLQCHTLGVRNRACARDFEHRHLTK